MRKAGLTLLILALAGCSPAGGPFPSLQPRAAEKIEPRLPVVRPINDRPVTPALASRLAELVGQARGGDAEFEPIIARAESLAATAGRPQSESWMLAQQALSAAMAAREITAASLGNIDGLAATRLQTQGGIAPNELAAIQNAGAEVAALDERQAARIKAVQGRLGL